MAKKTVDTKKQTKFFITDKEQHILRMAAAMKNESMAEFCRNVVLQQAHNIVKNFKPPKGS
ncbi:hypothetical protein [Gimesia sp.]|uniref:hypothetical protein n=1 Tax=Gimesia sp. TaxID=2024833 RepID=UPI003A8DDED7